MIRKRGIVRYAWVCVYVPVNDKVMIKEGKTLVR